MESPLLEKVRRALHHMEPMAAHDWPPAQSIARQLRWCLAYLTDQPREERPGPFSMGLIATREFDMYGDQPDLATLISEIQSNMERLLAASPSKEKTCSLNENDIES